MLRPALIIIDMLNDFLAKWSPGSRLRLVRSINELVGPMRRSGCPIIWVRQEFEPDLSDAFPEMRAKEIRTTIRGTEGSRMDAGLVTAPVDAVVIKKRYSAFHRTNLDQTLSELKPSGLIVAGINTHACIRTTAIDAYQREWTVILASECVDS